MQMIDSKEKTKQMKFFYKIGSLFIISLVSQMHVGAQAEHLSMLTQKDFSFEIFERSYATNTAAKINVLVYDFTGKIVWDSSISFLLDQKKVLTFTIPAFTLEQGNYVLSAKTLFSDGRIESVEEKSLSVLDNGEGRYEKYKKIVYLVLLCLAFISIVRHFVSDRVKIYKIKTLKKKLKNLK